MYYTGTIDISFERVDANNEEELKEKILDNLPGWLHAYNLEVEYSETQKDLMRDYVDDSAIERRLYD